MQPHLMTFSLAAMCLNIDETKMLFPTTELHIKLSVHKSILFEVAKCVLNAR